MRSVLTLGVIVKAQSQRCDDTVQDNCIVNDNQSPECKAFLSSKEEAWDVWETTWENQPALCREQGARMMKFANFYDISKLGNPNLNQGCSQELYSFSYEFELETLHALLNSCGHPKLRELSTTVIMGFILHGMPASTISPHMVK